MAQCSIKSLSYKALRIEDIPKGLQPRELLRKIGPRNVGEDTLLAVILRIGVHGANAIETARRLLVSFGSLDRLSRATCGEIVAKKIPGIGQTKALQIIAALELGRRCSYIDLMKGKEVGDKYIRTSGDLYDILFPQVYGSLQERFFVVLLGPRNKMLSEPIEVAKGQRDEVAFQANLIFEHPLKEGANAIKYLPSDERYNAVDITFKHYKLGIEITVESMGIKVDDSDLKRLGMRWFRGRNAIESNVQGEGLGLHAVVSCMRQSGFSIKFFSSGKTYRLNDFDYRKFVVRIRIPRQYVISDNKVA